MFSALKKLTGRSASADGNGGPLAPPPGLTTMSHSLQKKFGKGVHYNMKIILKGDRNVGKSQLFRRIQGQPFVEEYTATEEIQVANITWNYKTSDDIVKVEIWDVVDVSNRKKRLPSDKLKLENKDNSTNGELPAEIGLDANTIDVYKNTNGVIFIFDITKNWTLDYVKREIDNVPEHIPILIMGNRRDMGHHRAVASDTVLYFIEALERQTAEIRYTESSMRNGFGLKFIHKFFNLPYLHLQKASLLKQLDINREETEITIQELEFYGDSEDANYDLFIDSLSQKRRQVADALSPPKLSLAEAQAIASAKALKETKTSEDAIVAAARLQIKSDPTQNKVDLRAKKSLTNSNGANPNLNPELKPKSGANQNRGGGVEDFVPEEDIQITTFLEVDDPNEPGGRNNALHLEESSDDETTEKINPMVIATEEDIDFKDLVQRQPQQEKRATFTISDSENEEDKDNGDGEIGDITHSKIPSAKIGFQVFLGDDKGDKPKEKAGRNTSGDSGGSSSSRKKHSEKKSKHHKKKKEVKGQGHPGQGIADLEDFLSGGDKAIGAVDTSAYEAL